MAVVLDSQHLFMNHTKMEQLLLLFGSIGMLMLVNFGHQEL